jgi:tetratricopeptide (TPR) repeat protein
VDHPDNGGLVLLLSQALFATGQFQPAAGALQLAQQLLPEDQWGNVVKNYPELYPNIQNYTNQLRILESASESDAANPALRFLLGYHYGYLGYPRQAVGELDQVIHLQRQDMGAVRLRNMFAAQLGLPATPLPALPIAPAAPPPAS